MSNGWVCDAPEGENGARKGSKSRAKKGRVVGRHGRSLIRNIYQLAMTWILEVLPIQLSLKLESHSELEEAPGRPKAQEDGKLAKTIVR